MGDKAFITPTVLKWARETAHMTLETAAAKVPVAAARMEEWEKGTDQPTIRQAEILAKTYKRPFALLFLPDPPLDFQPLQDFRRKESRPWGTASIFIFREVQQKQSWTRNFLIEAGEDALPFVGRFTTTADPKAVAQDILLVLNINPAHYVASSPLREWLKKAEEKGIFIARSGLIHSRLKLDSDEFQGFAIADSHAPFVFINTDDWDAPQLFTLVHELAHIWINQSGVSGETSPEYLEQGTGHPVELFCNRVAAEALLPTHLMDQVSNDTFKSADSIFRAARPFGVSALTFLIRGLELQKVNHTQYAAMKTELEAAFLDFVQREAEKRDKQKKEKRGPDYYQLHANRNGHLFIKFVLDAFKGGLIQPTEASNLLGTSTNKFPKLEAFVY